MYPEIWVEVFFTSVNTLAAEPPNPILLIPDLSWKIKGDSARRVHYSVDFTAVGKNTKK